MVLMKIRVDMKTFAFYFKHTSYKESYQLGIIFSIFNWDSNFLKGLKVTLPRSYQGTCLDTILLPKKNQLKYVVLYLSLMFLFRRSMSPRNLRSASPRRRSLSRSPRYAAGGPRSRSRSPFANRRPSGAASNSPSDSLWKKRTYSPAGGGGGGRSRYSRSPPPATVHRPLSRNGHLESYSPDRRQRTKSPPAKLAAAVANEPDVLDNVSDISEGDIPDLPDEVQGEGETEVEQQQQQQQQPLQQQKQMLATESTPPPTVGSRNRFFALSLF